MSLGIISSHDVQAAAGITDPRAIPSLRVWYSAEAETGYADGATMTQWTDLSGNGWHATPYNGPVWQAATGPNGGPSVRFGTAATAISFTLPSAVMSGLSGTNGTEMFAVLKVDNNTQNSGHSRWGTNNVPVYTASNGNVAENFGTNSQYAYTPTMSVTTYRRLNIAAKTNSWQAWLDEVSQKTSATNDWATTAQPCIGGYPGQPDVVRKNYTCVLLYGRVLTATERAQVNTWLTAHMNGGHL